MTQVLELCIDIRIGDGLLAVFDLNTLVVLDFDFRIDLNGDRCGEAFALFDGGELNTGRINNLEFQFIYCCTVVRAQQIVDRIFSEHAFAVSLLDDAARRLALAESVNLELALVRLVNLDLGAFEFLSGEFHGEFGVVAFFADKCVFHCCSLLLL